MKTTTGVQAGTGAAEAVTLTLGCRKLAEPDGEEPPLSPAELRRAERFAVPELRRRFLASRQAARRFVAAWAGTEPAHVDADYHCPQCGGTASLNRSSGSHGIPRYRVRGRMFPARFSFSRSGDWLLAAALANGPLGVDLADISGFGGPGLDAVIATAAERAVLDAGAPGERTLGQARLWARKEAILKATGDGLRMAPDLVETGAGVVELPGPGGERLQVFDVDADILGAPSGLIAAVAVPAGEVRISRMHWD